MEDSKATKVICLTLMSINVFMPFMRLVFMLVDFCVGNPVDTVNFIFLMIAAVLTQGFTLMYIKGLVSDTAAINVTIEIAGLAFLVLGFVTEPHMMLVWVLGYTYMLFLIQAPNLQNHSTYRFIVYLKPVVFVCIFGFCFGRLVLTSHNDVFAMFSIVSFGYIASLVHNAEIIRRKNLMDSLCETKNQLDAIISAVPTGIVVITSEGNAVKANANALKAFDCKNGADIVRMLKNTTYKPGTHLYKLADSNPIDDIVDYIHSSQETLSTFGQVEVSELTLSIIGNKTSWHKKPAVVIVLKDVTDVIKLERTQNESQFKNVMLRSVSHELKTPTNGILHSVQGVASADDVPEWAKHKLKIAEVSCQHLLMLIYDLLDYSQLIAGKFRLQKTLFNLRQTIFECVELLHLVAEKKKIRLVTKIDPLLPEDVFTDSNRISQVLMNFLSNSIKFTPRGGRIEIKAVLNDQNQMEMSVTDSGVGISPQNIDKLFEAFSLDNSTASINPQGVGLGLHISNMLAIQLGDSPISVVSNQGVGSCFTVVVSIFKVKPANPIFSDLNMMTCQLTDSFIETNKVYQFLVTEVVHPPVLVVDDSPFNRSVIVDILKLFSIECAEAENGVEAIEMVLQRAQKSKPFSVVLMDFEMPLMNGPTACRNLLFMLKERNLPLPSIIAHTAYSSEDDEMICREAGMIDFLPKPASRDMILAKVRQYLLDR